jgi:hypothetical protein
MKEQKKRENEKINAEQSGRLPQPLLPTDRRSDSYTSNTHAPTTKALPSCIRTLGDAAARQLFRTPRHTPLPQKREVPTQTHNNGNNKNKTKNKNTRVKKETDRV